MLRSNKPSCDHSSLLSPQGCRHQLNFLRFLFLEEKCSSLLITKLYTDVYTLKEKGADSLSMNVDFYQIRNRIFDIFSPPSPFHLSPFPCFFSINMYQWFIHRHHICGHLSFSLCSPHAVEVNKPVFPDCSSAVFSFVSASASPFLLFEAFSLLALLSLSHLLLHFAPTPTPPCLRSTSVWLYVPLLHLCSLIWMGSLVLININGPPAVK